MNIRKTLMLLLVIGWACKKNTAADPAIKKFEETPITRPLKPGVLDEASGIADSKANPDHLWVQQDSGNPNELALLSHNGGLLKKIVIKTASNRDWEDMALGNGPVAGTHYIYLADIGDNTQTSSTYFIYRFAEPATAMDTVFNCDEISFVYPDGAHDAEAILIDNSTRDIYIITKQDMPSRIYKLSYPQSTSAVNMAVLSGTLSFSGVTAAAISPDGKEIVAKTYTSIYYWTRNTNQSLEQSLMTAPVTLDYQFEPQGEAICFKNDNSGFFTLSERPSVIAAVNLNFYKRK